MSANQRNIPSSKSINPEDMSAQPKVKANAVPQQEEEVEEDPSRSTVIYRDIHELNKERKDQKMKRQLSPDLISREVDIGDIPSQYKEAINTFCQVIKITDPRETMPVSSITVMGLNLEVQKQEARHKGPSLLLPPTRAQGCTQQMGTRGTKRRSARGPAPPPYTGKLYKVSEPCFEEKLRS